MITPDISANLSGVMAGPDAFGTKHLPFAAAVALIGAVNVAQRAEQAVVPSVFDRSIVRSRSPSGASGWLRPRNHEAD